MNQYTRPTPAIRDRGCAGGPQQFKSIVGECGLVTQLPVCRWFSQIMIICRTPGPYSIFLFLGYGFLCGIGDHLKWFTAAAGLDN